MQMATQQMTTRSVSAENVSTVAPAVSYTRPLARERLSPFTPRNHGMFWVRTFALEGVQLTTYSGKDVFDSAKNELKVREIG